MMSPALLSADIIARHLKVATAADCCIDVLPEVNSTNDYLKANHLRYTQGMPYIFAEKQTHAHGRHGKTWHTGDQQNILLSCLWTFPESVHALTGFSLVISDAIYQTLHPFAPANALKIKWPNDVYWSNNKISGCLIELIQTGQQRAAVIGIGININMPAGALPNDFRWTSLQQETNQIYDRNLLAASLIDNLQITLTNYQHYGFQPFYDKWAKQDYLLAKQIRVTGSQTITGRYQGINEHGHCLICLPNNKITTIQSGSIELL